MFLRLVPFLVANLMSIKTRMLISAVKVVEPWGAHSTRARTVHHGRLKRKKTPTSEGLVHHIWWTSGEPKVLGRRKLTALKAPPLVALVPSALDAQPHQRTGAAAPPSLWFLLLFNICMEFMQFPLVKLEKPGINKGIRHWIIKFWKSLNLKFFCRFNSNYIVAVITCSDVI